MKSINLFIYCSLTQVSTLVICYQDENEDGLFSMDELSKWLETNKIVKLVEEGNDAEVDKLIAQQAKKLNEEKVQVKDEQQKE